MSNRLDMKQSVKQFINSNGSLKRWSHDDAERHKNLGHKTMESKNAIRTEMQKERLRTEMQGFCEMEVTNEYMSMTAEKGV